MPKAWKDVAASDEYKALPPDQQESARQDYFKEVVAPKVSADQLDAVRNEFDQATKTTVGSPSQAAAEKFAGALQRDQFAGALDTGMKGLTWGLSDQLAAGEAAIGTGIENTGRALVGAKQPYSAGEAYRATLKAREGAEKKFSDAHPVGAVATELAGGLAAPGVGAMGDAIAAGKTVLARAGRGLIAGGTAGAVAGGAEDAKTPEEHLWNAVRGAGTGGLIGGSLPALGSLAKPAAARITSALSAAWQQGVQAVTGSPAGSKVLTPAEQQKATEFAMQHVRELIQKTGKTLPDLLKDEAFLAGKPVTSAETIGRPAISQLLSIGRRQGLTPDQLESFLRQRQQERPDRIINSLGKAAGVDPHMVQGNFDTAVRDLRKLAKPLYDIANDTGPFESEKLTELLKRPSVKQALAGARQIAAEEGRNPDDVGLIKVMRPGQAVVDPQTGKPVWGPGPETEEEIEVKNPTMQTWDYVKRALGDVVYRDRDALGRPNLDTKGRAVRDTLDELREELFKNTAYKDAVAAGGEPIRMEEAYKSAPKLMRGSVSESDFEKQVSRYTPAELQAAKGGLINDTYTQARSGKLKMKDMLQPAYVTKMRRFLGDEPADQFIKDVKLEQILAANDQRLMPGTNSVTAELMTASDEVDKSLANIAHVATDLSRGRYFQAARGLLGAPYHGGATPFNEGERNEIGRLLQMPPDQLKAQLDAAAAHMNVGASPADDIINKILGRMAVTGASQVNQ
jgi:enamine deaminase RidA (YjgF/YER057c/UK114 family)